MGIARYEGDTTICRNGGCSLCGRTENLVTLDDAIQGEGLYVLCHGCIHDAAMVAGFTLASAEFITATDNALSALTDSLAEAEAQRDEAVAKLSQLRDQWVEAVEVREQALTAAAEVALAQAD